MFSARPESVFIGRDCELLPQMFAFYAPDARVVRDVTANARRMWKGVELMVDDLKWYDIDPAMKPDVVCSFDALPDKDDSVCVLVYDPPHLPAAAGSEHSLAHFKKNYGLERSVEGDNIDAFHDGFIKEAKRVLRKDGLIFAKIKDYVHNHAYQWCMSSFVAQARAAGLTACDLIIKRDPAAGNLKSGRWQNAHHARNVHCYWIVVRKGRCEPRKPLHQSEPDGIVETEDSE